MGKANINNKHKQLATTIMQSLTFISALQFTITCIVSEIVKTLQSFFNIYNWKWNTQSLNQSKTIITKFFVKYKYNWKYNTSH